MANADFFYDDDEECWQCSGEGGWNSCQEDCCPVIGDEEMCMDLACWRRCDVCEGTGFLCVSPETEEAGE